MLAFLTNTSFCCCQGWRKTILDPKTQSAHYEQSYLQSLCYKCRYCSASDAGASRYPGCLLCRSEKRCLPAGRANFFFSPWNFLREGNTWTPSCIFVKLFFEVQQLNDHRLKSWGMTFLTCEPCRALWGLGLYHGGWVFWLWSGI